MEGLSNNNNSDSEVLNSSDSGRNTVLKTRMKKIVNGIKSKKKRGSVLATSRSEPNYERALVPITNQRNFLRNSKGWTTIVNVVLVEAKGLPIPREDGSAHYLYCEIQLNPKTYTSKAKKNTGQAKWGQRFDFRLYEEKSLKLSLWDKGKQKNFMGSTIFDISNLEMARTHDVCKELDNGFGKIHFSVTMCKVKQTFTDDENNFHQRIACAKDEINNLISDWKLVGKLLVKVIGAKGLNGTNNAYCTLELDNERVQTHSVQSSEPIWNKSYLFDVHDVTSTLDLKVYDSSIWSALRIESLGRVSIPLLDINNGETRWVGLKDKSKRRSAKGNCPRVQLEMTMIWNPVKATARLFRPKEVKYTKKPPKFDLFLVYSNMKFIRDTFNAVFELNEQIKRLFEWENQELSLVVLIGWLVFWYYFRLWATPLLLLIPFFYFWIVNSNQTEEKYCVTGPYQQVIEDSSENNENIKTDIANPFVQLMSDPTVLKDLTFTITDGVEYSVSTAEKLYNLATFKVPFLSLLAMIFLFASALGFYFIPINYMMMAFGVYKFTRKYLNPERTLNNDLVDFLSRIPDNEMLKDWKELNVPEPTSRPTTFSLQRSTSV